jgi:hypothetical protein
LPIRSIIRAAKTAEAVLALAYEVLAQGCPLPQPMPFSSAAANFAGGTDTPREFRHRITP